MLSRKIANLSRGNVGRSCLSKRYLFRLARLEQVARTVTPCGVRAFSVAITAAVAYSIAASKLRRPFLSDFFIAVRQLRRREKFTEPDSALWARAFNRAG